MQGSSAVITGVGRRQGIGYATAREFIRRGATVFLTHYEKHDHQQPWGADPLGSEGVIDSLRAERVCEDQRIEHMEADLSRPGAAEEVFRTAGEALGEINILVCNHAQSGWDGSLTEIDEARLDRHFAVNARAGVLLAREFAKQYSRHDDDEEPRGRLVFLTSGQNLGPMPGEVAYAASKGAIVGVIMTLSEELAPRGISVNAVNPGPVDTGYVDEKLRRQTEGMFPFGRWGKPEDPARLITWLCSDEGYWVTGQVINSEGGFRRWGGG